VLELNLMMTLAAAYTIGGHLQDAIATYEQAAREMTQLGRDDTQAAGTLFSDWGLALTLIGRPREAESVLRRAIDVGQDHRGEDSVSPMLLTNYARTLRDAGRYEEASEYAERAHELAVRLGVEAAVNHALLTRSRNYLAQGDTDRAEVMLDEAEQRLRQVLPEGHYAFASVFSQRSLLAQLRGDLTGSLRLAEEGLRIVEASQAAGQQTASALDPLLTQRSEVRLALGQTEGALEDAARARRLQQDSVPAGTYTIKLGRAYVTLARALDAQGDREGARAALESALEHFQDAAGPDHPETLRARELLETMAAAH
jgi:tetratricopeptide (TPR) repeat protein